MRKLFIKTMTVVALCFFIVPSIAQSPGSLDATFNAAGTGIPVTSPVCHAVQADGKIVIGGYFTTYNGVTKNGIARLNADGTLDATFITGNGFLQASGGIGSVYDIKIQPDGKILVAGLFARYNGTDRYDLIRLNTNGTLDTTFNAGIAGRVLPNDGGASNRLFVLPNGQILVGGQFWTWNGNASSSLVKINANGSFDSSFTSLSGNGPGGGSVNTFQLLPDGRVLLGGALQFFNSQITKGLVIINQNGTTSVSFPTTGYQLQTSLPGGGTALGNLSCAFMEPSGKIVISGQFWIAGVAKAMARINTSGGVESTFNLNDPNISYSYGLLKSVPGTTKYLLGTVNYSTVLPGQKRMIRVLSDGTIDTSFNLDSNMTTVDSFRDVTFLANEQMILSGRFVANFGGTNKFGIVRLNGGSCANDLTITANVNSPFADNQQASNTIVASNTINSGASAIYHATNSVLLTPSFVALSGATVHIYNAGCTGTFLARTSEINVSQDNVTVADSSERNEIKKIKVFPNPTYGIFKITTADSKEGTVVVSDLYGATIFKSDFKDQNEVEINIQDKPKGIYIVKVISDKHIYTNKIIKN